MGASPVEDAAGGTATSVLGSGFRFSLFGFRAFQTSDLGPRTSALRPQSSDIYSLCCPSPQGFRLWALGFTFDL